MYKQLMKGNEAIAEGAIRAGCRFYAGYPITPQSEILEYMSKHMPENGGIFMQGESEVASVSMLWGAAAAGVRGMTSSSGPGFSLKQEGIAYIASYEVPAVIVSVMRYGIGGGDITQGQDSYLQAVKGGGNGDYRLIVFSPNSVNECANLTYEAFDIAEKYKNPALILGDGAIGQMVEMCDLPQHKEHDINKYSWSIKGRPAGEKKYKATNLNWYYGDREWEKMVRDKYRAIMDNEQRWENYCIEDAEMILVAYGISSRVCIDAVNMARGKGVKLGLIRPITLWPYPRNAFYDLPATLKGFMVVEMSITAQMKEDVILASKAKYPVFDYCTAIDIPIAENIVSACEDALEGRLAEREEL
jgi:Pyruvate:ferredoxin oxidoreductase and related 2-oxoacid:ferredoxin oxidoreductases, alpha subunit